ncbi:MAG TPA: LytTR family DNA-binding domain-containing protein [Lentimicrobium sp.]|nr:LytTR family DNA-binding domain-containing protein [Lentimicrobium sp.]
MINVLIVEDEKIAAERLEKLIRETAPDMNIVARLTSVKESVKWLLENRPDLIFLDIQLSDGLSFSIFDTVTITKPIIFTTAYDQYAIKAFKLNSISYLLKPVRKEDLAEALTKFRTFRQSQPVDFESLLNAIKGNVEYRKRFLIQVGEKFRKIETTDIAYFYACEKSVFMKTLEGNNYPCDHTLDALEEILDPSLFFRINRRYLINMKSIRSMLAWSRSRIKVTVQPPADDEMDTIVSIDRTSDFKNWINK